MAKKVTFRTVRPEGFEYPTGLNSEIVFTDTRVNIASQMAAAAPSGLVNPTSPEGQQNYFNPNDPGPNQRVYHTFRQSGVFTCGFTGNVDIVIVAGGGAGGGGYGGGGGGGGVVHMKEVTVFDGQTYPVLVGAGGSALPHNPPQRGTPGNKSEVSLYAGAHPMCNTTGFVTANGGGGGGAYGRSGNIGTVPGLTVLGGGEPGGSGGGGGGYGGPNEESLGGQGSQDPNFVTFTPVDGGLLDRLGNPYPITAPNANPYYPHYPYPTMSPPMNTPQYLSGGAQNFGSGNTQHGMPGGQGTTSFVRPSPFPGTPSGPFIAGGGGGGAGGQGFGVGYNPPSPPPGTPLQGFGGNGVGGSIRGVPLGPFSDGGGAGGSGPLCGGSGGASGDGGTNVYPFGYLPGVSGTANRGGGGGGGGAPGTYPSPDPGGPDAPGSGGSGVVFFVYNSTTGELANGAVYSIN